MDLNEFSSPLPKPWLDIVSNSVETNHVAFVDQEPVPNAPAGEHRLYFSNLGRLSSVDSTGKITRYVEEVTYANVVMLGYNVLYGPQVNTNILVGLSPGSILTIPANTLKPGDVYRLKVRLNANAVVTTPGEIDFGTVAQGIMQIMDISTTQTGTNYVNAPIEVGLDMIVTGAHAVNISASFSACVPQGMSLSPLYFGTQTNTPDVALDTTIDQTITLTYLTPAFISVSISEILFYKISNTF